MTYAELLLSDELADLAEDHGVIVRIEHDLEAPSPWAVWSEDPDGIPDEILGAGETRSEAIEEACATMRGWKVQP